MQSDFRSITLASLGRTILEEERTGHQMCRPRTTESVTGERKVSEQNKSITAVRGSVQAALAANDRIGKGLRGGQ